MKYLPNSTSGRVGLLFVALVAYAVVHGLFVRAGRIGPAPVAVTPRASAPSTAWPAPVRGVADVPAPQMAVRPYLREHLNDWDSYNAMAYSEPEAIANHNGVPAWRVRHTYRAKNGFGGVVRNDQLFYYTAHGVYKVIDVRP